MITEQMYYTKSVDKRRAALRKTDQIACQVIDGNDARASEN